MNRYIIEEIIIRLPISDLIRLYDDCLLKPMVVRVLRKIKVDWEWVSYRDKLSEDFIREFKAKLDWGYMSIGQTLSEDFIREFKCKVDWYKISRYQKLSEDFIREFAEKLN